ncbi:MAG: hypothetical protein Q4E67_01475 [Planctomycetia bacterium]|nr:hypothetical protein [Planctomycetia bacterium]
MGTGVFLSAAEYTWTGGGADSHFTTAANWGGNNLFIVHATFGLTQNNNSAAITAILPEGAYAQTNGFDITNGTITVGGKLDSIRTSSGSFNGFWMRGNSTITLLPTAEFTFLNRNGGTDASAQLTMAGGNNTVNKYDTSSLSFDNMFISTYDCSGGVHNVVNHYAGGISANAIRLGTYSTNFTAEPSQYNLYGGTVSATQMWIQYDTIPQKESIRQHGRGELNVYGGEFTVGTLSGGQSVSNSVTYYGDINVRLNETSGFGTFAVTGDSDYNGNVNVTMDSPVLTLSPTILETPLVNFAGNVSADMQLMSNSSLITFSEDNKTARLNPAKNVTPDGGYTVGTALSFEQAATEGYLSINASGDPYLLSLLTTEFNSEADMNSFVDWLNESVENYSFSATGLSSLQIDTFAANTDAVFLWDFTGYASGVGVLGIASQQVPEPNTWILALLGIALYWGRYYAKSWVCIG